MLSHLIKIQDEEFLKKYTASQLASSPVNIITPTPGMFMFVVLVLNLRDEEESPKRHLSLGLEGART